MKDDYLRKEGNRIVKVLPAYLVAQGTILLMTFLDFPLYMEAYQARQNLSVTGWFVVWFVLVLFGLTTGVLLLVSKTWKAVFQDNERGKLWLGYLSGGLTGLLTLGIRFMPIIPPQFFFVIGGMVLLLIIAYLVWRKRQAKLDEMFP